VDRSNALINNAAGVVWRTANIAEAEVTVSILTMIFVAYARRYGVLQFVIPTCSSGTGQF
jgi:hypothetical protein